MVLLTRRWPSLSSAAAEFAAVLPFLGLLLLSAEA